MIWVLLLCSITAVMSVNPEQDQYGEEEARHFMENLNRERNKRNNQAVLAEWDYESNLNDDDALQKKLALSAEYAEWEKKQWQEVMKFPWKKFKDPLLRRQFKKYSTQGTSALPEDKRARLDEVIAEMQRLYSTTKLREWSNSTNSGRTIKEAETIQLEPDLVLIFGSGTNNTCKLQYYWHGWHGSVGRKVKSLFEEYVNLTNEAARLNNFTDAAAMWNDDFEMNNFEEQIHKLYLQILPLYKQLHAYVRRKLSDNFNNGDKIIVAKDGFLPAHILGTVFRE